MDMRFSVNSCKVSLKVVTLVGGGVSIALQSLLKLIKIVLCHCHLPLHQQNVLDGQEGARLSEGKKHTVRNKTLDTKQKYISLYDGNIGVQCTGNKMIWIKSI